MPNLTVQEVAKHNNENDCYIIIRGKIYDVTNFLEAHPGGKKMLLSVAGKDATKSFEQFHAVDRVLVRWGAALEIGEVVSALGGLIEKNQKKVNTKLFRKQGEHFGDLLPFADPMWYQDWYSPYYNESHFRLAKWAREIRSSFLDPRVEGWYENEGIPLSDVKAWGQLGMIAIEMPKEVYSYLRPDFPVPAGLDPHKIDGFHHLFLSHELLRSNPGIGQGNNIGLPPIVKFASEEMKKRVIPIICEGEANICLAITEPSGGSDVQNLQTTAKLSDDGKFFIVNGLKKWTSGSYDAQFLTTAVRTGGPGASGVSLLLIEKRFGGVKTRRLKTMGHHAGKTCLVEFDNVKVPVENLIGKLGEGFKYVVYNFNGERIMLVRNALSNARLAYEEALKYAHRRKTFGKNLIEHPVIRNKLANMSGRIESVYAWLELVVYQVEKFGPENHEVLNQRIGGITALLKAQSTQCLEYCAKEAAQIFGGLAYTRGGQGGQVERIFREQKLFTIGGGSEEVMLDFGVRDSLKVARLMGAPLDVA